MYRIFPTDRHVKEGEQCRNILDSNFRRVLNVVWFLLGDTPASEFYMPTFRNTLFHLHRHSTCIYLPMKMEQTECSETSTHKIQTPGNHPEESIQQCKNILYRSYSWFIWRSGTVVGPHWTRLIPTSLHTNPLFAPSLPFKTHIEYFLTAWYVWGKIFCTLFLRLERESLEPA